MTNLELDKKELSILIQAVESKVKELRTAKVGAEVEKVVKEIVVAENLLNKLLRAS